MTSVRSATSPCIFLSAREAVRQHVDCGHEHAAEFCRDGQGQRVNWRSRRSRTAMLPMWTTRLPGYPAKLLRSQDFPTRPCTVAQVTLILPLGFSVVARAARWRPHLSQRAWVESIDGYRPKAHLRSSQDHPI